MSSKIETILAQGENISTEFKLCSKSLPKNLFETVCAFLNRIGGDILLGVSDQGKIIGVDKRSVVQIKKTSSPLAIIHKKFFPPHISLLMSMKLMGKQYYIFILPKVPRYIIPAEKFMIVMKMEILM